MERGLPEAQQPGSQTFLIRRRGLRAQPPPGSSVRSLIAALRGLDAVLRVPDGLLCGLDAVLRELDELLRGLDAVLRELDDLLRKLDAVLREPDDLLRGLDAVLRTLDAALQTDQPSFVPYKPISDHCESSIVLVASIIGS